MYHRTIAHIAKCIWNMNTFMCSLREDDSQNPISPDDMAIVRDNYSNYLFNTHRSLRSFDESLKMVQEILQPTYIN